MIVRQLTDDDTDAARELSGLAFGYTPEAVGTKIACIRVGAFDEAGRLMARAIARPYTQWWCGREVPMSGIAGVAVHPDGRGQGLVRRMLDVLVAESPEPISVLYPTAPGIYRSQGWEVVGSLDETRISLVALPTTSPPGVTLRSATPEDLPALHALYAARGASGSGLLTRTGPSFPAGVEGLLESDVVTVAIEDGTITGWAGYDRGQGYRDGGPLEARDCVASTPTALLGLVASLAGWSAVVRDLLWRGRSDDLALVLGRTLPAPSGQQPWMLRVLDPVAAVAARGFVGTGTASFAVEGQGYRLEVLDGQGELTRIDAGEHPVVPARGLSLLFAGVATGRLQRAGLVDRPAPELEALFAGPAPEILDYF